MLSTLLAIAILGPTPDPGEQARIAATDLAFVGAVEDFARPPVPPLYRDIFRRMGDDRYAVREDATREAVERLRDHPDEIRWLLGARNDRDPEIRIRIASAGRQASRCAACKGTGISTAWSGMECYGCWGRRHTWPFNPWD